VPARAAEADDPTAPIQQLNASLLAAMKAGQNTPFAQRFAMLSPAVEHAFELNALLRGAVGLGWDNISVDQQAALASTFRRYTVSNYTANFDTYEGQSFRVLPETRALPNGAIVVRTQIVRPSKSPVEISYVMRQTTAGWKAVDVLSDGTISQVAAQRSDFRSLLASGGAAALRAGLERKVAMLSNGAMA
jgi:phospholipid transport system substrate-binding protein